LKVGFAEFEVWVSLLLRIQSFLMKFPFFYFFGCLGEFFVQVLFF
jgi:hypothetical protein